ncbi:MAG: hypothetical protein M3384_03185 [Acidobacteriota bacterium]|nr:hypothetical protein [Acidobacteriota bacterium]
MVNPPREVWERSELTPVELTLWSFLVAATARAMLERLPQLANGCINYWEAGNWALNEMAEPEGVLKNAREYRKVHLHLLGRSQQATNASWKWGEAPKFPDYAERLAWASDNQRLRPDECINIVRRIKTLLTQVYGLHPSQISQSTECKNCGYPTPASSSAAAAAVEQETLCPECEKK